MSKRLMAVCTQSRQMHTIFYYFGGTAKSPCSDVTPLCFSLKWDGGLVIMFRVHIIPACVGYITLNIKLVRRFYVRCFAIIVVNSSETKKRVPPHVFHTKKNYCAHDDDQKNTHTHDDNVHLEIFRRILTHLSLVTRYKQNEHITAVTHLVSAQTPDSA